MNDKIKYDIRYTEGAVGAEDLEKIFPEVQKAHSLIMERTGEGGNFLGWVDLPDSVDDGMLADIEETAAHLNAISDITIVAGIGGSYLGAKAAIDALSSKSVGKKIVFAGYNLSGTQWKAILDRFKDEDVTVNVISKSGTTTETAVAFRLLERALKEKYGECNVAERIVCTTDKKNGALKKIADERGYKTFVIPDDVGGRFSVLTPVGLFPIACSGVDIRQILAGARAQKEVSLVCDLDKNISYKYAAVRNILYRKGKHIEILSSFDNRMHYMDEWWKQLFGESEGKNMQGIYPASCEMTTDLHSMGQFIQQGERCLFETFMVFEDPDTAIIIPEDKDNIDNLNYLAGKQVNYVNRKAYEATAEAHFEGGVPNSTIFIPELSAFSLGQLFYFFEAAVAASAYIFGVNPFDQPGVEAYKQKMFKLLGKPGV